jgi:hypothetical protein
MKGKWAKDKEPDWWQRFVRLRITNPALTYGEIAGVLNSEGYKGKHGGPIYPDTIRNRLAHLKRSGTE